MAALSLHEITEASRRIAGRIVATGMAVSPALSEVAGTPVLLKLEHRQSTGSFKLRGATNAIALLAPAEKSRGVVACSTGNHGRALAHAARLEGMRAVICMSPLVPGNKLDEIRRLGAEIRIVGNSQDDAEREAGRLADGERLVMVPPFDDPRIVAGQATVGLEIMEQAPDAAVVLVPLSGGGLAGGVATAVKAVSPATRVIGVSMERGAAMKASLDAGRPVPVEELPTLADSLGGGIGIDNRLTFALCRNLLDDVVLVSEAEIAAGIRHAYFREREIVEGAGAVGIAALLAGKVKAGGPMVVLLSGRNIDMEAHRGILSGVSGRAGELAS
jgi:threonine dehydratase